MKPNSYGERTILHFELTWPTRRLYRLIELGEWSNITESIPSLRRQNSIKIGKYMLEMLKPARF
jgi:hypothetical protein